MKFENRLILFEVIVCVFFYIIIVVLIFLLFLGYNFFGGGFVGGFVVGMVLVMCYIVGGCWEFGVVVLMDVG